MAQEIYELRINEQEAIRIGAVRLDLCSILRQILRRISVDQLSYLYMASYADSDTLPEDEATFNDRILAVEGDLAGLELRGKWAGDEEKCMEIFVQSLARTSGAYYRSKAGFKRLQKVRNRVRELMG